MIERENGGRDCLHGLMGSSPSTPQNFVSNLGCGKVCIGSQIFLSHGSQALSPTGAGRGLFVKKALHASLIPKASSYVLTFSQASMEPILSIPAESLLNSRTLRPIYPSIPLEGFANTNSPSLVINGTQLLSIHLALNRPVGEDSSSRDPRFGPYIDTCPRDFDSHPLTWLVRQREGTALSYEEELLRWLPPSSYNGLNEVAKRFWDDWRVALRSKVSGLFDIHPIQLIVVCV